MKKILCPVIFLVLVLGLNVYFRTFTIYFPQLKTQAQDIVERRTRQAAIQEVKQKFPDFDTLAKESLINSLTCDYRKKEKSRIKTQVQDEYRKLKDRYQDASGQTYLMELDCWHWARYVDNVVRLGRAGDKVIGGRQFDAFMLAPNGIFLSWNHFLFYASAFLYKCFIFFKPVPLFTFLFYLPLLFTAILITSLFLFCFYRWGVLSAVISCLFVGLAPLFLSRSCAGWFDTDILDLLLPILLIWAYLKALGALGLRARVISSGLSAFCIGLFCFTWTSWWFIFLIILIYEAYSLANLISMHWQYKEDVSLRLKQHLITLASFLVFSFIWIVLLCGIEPLTVLSIQIKEAIILNKPLTASLWPNVYATVGELEKAELFKIAHATGGKLLFLSGLISLLILFLRAAHSRKSSGTQGELIVILTFWFMSMFFACLKGIRFSMFLLIPLGVSLGWASSDLYAHLRKRKRWGMPLGAAIIALVCLTFLINANYAARGLFPIINDTWYNALVKVKNITPKDAIINSWWDFGDWFKVVSERRVIFDGQSQNTPQAYWMACVLINNKEEEAVRILKMLNNGGSKTFEIINQQLDDPLQAAFIVKQVMAKDDKRESLLKFLSPSASQEVNRLLSGRPGKAYFIADSTMQHKMLPISYLANWDFTKVFLIKSINKKKKPEVLAYLVKLGMEEKEAERLYQEAALISPADLESWVSRRVNFYSSLLKGRENNGSVFFDGGVVFNDAAKAIYVYSPIEGIYKVPKSLFLFKQDKMEEIKYAHSELDFSVLVFQDKNNWQAILLAPELANSLYVRLYFLEGRGMQHFKLVLETKDEYDSIKVFEILWD